MTQCVTAQHSTAQHGTARHGTARHSTAQHSTAERSTASWPSSPRGSETPAEGHVVQLAAIPQCRVSCRLDSWNGARPQAAAPPEAVRLTEMRPACRGTLSAGNKDMYLYMWVRVRLQKECSKTLCATLTRGKASKSRSSMAACILVSSSMYTDRGQLHV